MKGTNLGAKSKDVVVVKPKLTIYVGSEQG